MRIPFTIKEIQSSKVASLNTHLFEPVKKKRSKYNNVKVEFDGHIFDSQRECNYYVGLRALFKAGEITDLKLQVDYELNECGTHSLIYIADFVWTEKGRVVVCDVKGFRTAAYKKKRALMLKIYGIEIKEV